MTAAPLARLLDAIHRIRAAVGQVVPAANHYGPRAVAWLWLVNLAESLTRLIDRVAAGTLKPSPRRAAPARPAEPASRLKLPGRQGWLARDLPQLVPLAGELAALLAHPDLQPLLIQEPGRFGRLLRPLCRALGIDPPEPLRPAAPPPKAAPAKAAPAEAALAEAAPPPARAALQPDPFPAPPRTGDAALDLLRAAPPARRLPIRRALGLGVSGIVPGFG